jgi:hypothetical protein
VNTIHVGEYRTPIAVGDRYVVKGGSSCYWHYVTVTAVSRDWITYDSVFPHGSNQTRSGCLESPSSFARHFVWEYFAEKIAA